MQDYHSSLDSPSRQLVLDLARELEQVRIHTFELKQVKAYERRTFYEKLDQIDREVGARHYAALDKVAARHDKVREEAEETLREHLRQAEIERLQKEEEARKERERIEREKAEKLRREQEKAARLETERRAKEEAQRKAAEEVERAKKAAQEEQERKEHERLEAEKRQREAERQKAEQEAAQHAEQARAEKQKEIGAKGQTEQEAKVHQRYLELHQHLKKFREYLRNEGKSNATLKQTMGDMRRTITKCVGQIREGREANRGQVQEIKATMEKAAAFPGQPSVDIRQFIAFPPDHIANSDDNKVPALMIYCFNIFSKCLIASLLTEASVNQNHAEPVGIVAAQIFSAEPFIYKGIPMSDILWAKYRFLCPALWGLYGDEKTEAGKRAVGWRLTEPGGPFISEQEHGDRMTALGAGFAAITLRNFGKTARQNPFPNTIFWHSMHKISSIPLNEMPETHVIILSAVLRSSAERVVGFFGHIGLALMRRAIVDIPNGLPRQTTAVNQLRLLKDLYLREKAILI